MKKVLFMVIASIISLQVFAQTANSGSESSSGSISGANAGASADSSNVNKQGQQQGQSTNVQSGQQQGNSQNITFNSPDKVNYSGDYTVRSAPQVFAPPVGVTAPCMIGYSAGVSVIGAGVALGGGKEDTECTRREYARMLHAMGETKGAVALLCQNENVAKAMPGRCVAANSPDMPAPVQEVKNVEKIVEKPVYIPTVVPAVENKEPIFAKCESIKKRVIKQTLVKQCVIK
jgi:hypothetical protein